MRTCRVWFVAGQSVRALGIRAGAVVRFDVRRKGVRDVRVQTVWPDRRALGVRAFERRVRLFRCVPETQAWEHMRDVEVEA